LSRLLVVTHPSLAAGFHLAGVEAFAAADAQAAQEIVGGWLAAGERGLIAIDDDLLNGFDRGLVRRLEAAEGLYHLSIPSRRPDESEAARRRRIAEMIRRAIGFEITFTAGQAERAQ
jgi:vacuolar-type H+-ATPase subunit F/Vma7